jgi:predicted DCC family thiol-disulfide oxidoreductase YuxK
MRGTVVFDGSCSFCQAQIQRFRRLTIPGEFEFLPKQAPGLEERFPALASDEFATGMRFVAVDGTVSVGADAVYQIARGMRGVLIVAWLYRVPGLRRVARVAYGWVARNRQRLGSTPTDTDIS